MLARNFVGKSPELYLVGDTCRARGQSFRTCVYVCTYICVCYMCKRIVPYPLEYCYRASRESYYARAITMCELPAVSAASNSDKIRKKKRKKRALTS